MAFSATMLGSWLQVFTWPARDFLRESHRLLDEPLVRELRLAVVQLEGLVRSGWGTSSYHGTGFNISGRGIIVTNRHLVDEALRLDISFPEKGRLQATAWYHSPHTDLAVVEIPGNDLPYVELAERSPNPGEEVIIIGNPLELRWMVKKGRVIGKRRLEGLEKPVLEIRAPIQRGSSGSPVFNQEGQVVGVVFATARAEDESETRCLAVSVEDLRSFLGFEDQ